MHHIVGSGPKKKLVVEKDFNPYRAKKTLFHAFRFGIQIAKNSKIVNYEAVTDLYKEIAANTSEEWNTYDTLYRKKFRELQSEFKLVAPIPLNSDVVDDHGDE